MSLLKVFSLIGKYVLCAHIHSTDKRQGQHIYKLDLGSVNKLGYIYNKEIYKLDFIIRKNQ